jgi:hypothetical protein
MNSTGQAALLALCVLALTPDDAYAGCTRYPPIEIGSVVQRPKSFGELLRNLKVAWDNNFVVLPAFFIDDNLRTFFNASSITWGPSSLLPPGSTPPGLPQALVVPDAAVFSATTIFLTYALSQNPSEAALKSGRFIVKLDPKSNLTLGAVREVFGKESSTSPTSVPVDVQTSTGNFPVYMPHGDGPTITYEKRPDPSATGCAARRSATFTVSYAGGLPRETHGNFVPLPDEAGVISILFSFRATE